MLTSLVPLVVGFLGSQQPVTVQGAVASFGVSVQATPTGWSARCDSGCTWREVSFECATACDALVASTGLFTVATLPPRPTSFVFFLTRTRTGVSAHARQGTAWTRLGWSCDACRVSVDAYGVRGVK